MGLDMYLRGRKAIMDRYLSPETAPKIDGFFVTEYELDLGYWRKHPDLHGFIVQTFADGVDECQQIDLSEADLERLILGIETGALPTTTGFFFGTSARTPEERDEDLAFVRAALAWRRGSPPGTHEFRSVYYRASW